MAAFSSVEVGRGKGGGGGVGLGVGVAGVVVVLFALLTIASFAADGFAAQALLVLAAEFLRLLQLQTVDPLPVLLVDLTALSAVVHQHAYTYDTQY